MLVCISSRRANARTYSAAIATHSTIDTAAARLKSRRRTRGDDTSCGTAALGCGSVAPKNHSRGRLCHLHSPPAAADPGERSAVVPEAGVDAAEEGAELAGVVLDVADAVDVQLAARELAVGEAARAGERVGR